MLSLTSATSGYSATSTSSFKVRLDLTHKHTHTHAETTHTHTLRQKTVKLWTQNIQEKTDRQTHTETSLSPVNHEIPATLCNQREQRQRTEAENRGSDTASERVCVCV